MRRKLTAAAIAAVLPLALACQSNGDDAPEAAAAAAATAPATAAESVDASVSAALVRVSLQNVANDLAAQLSVDRAALPADTQASVEVASRVCGVSVKVLSVATGEQAACAAKTASAELGRLVQPQLAASGSAAAPETASPPAAQPPTTPN